MPAAPASNAGGSATITYSRQPTSQHSPPTSTASAMSVPMTLRRIRGRAFRAGILGPTIIATTGPRPNMTAGLRKSR